jgi:hypothetical protein
VTLDPADPAPGVQFAERRWLAERLPWPEDVPRGRALVAFWAGLQEPFDPRWEAARQVPVMGGDGYRTEYPYHERLTQTLWAYLRAPAGLRRLVVAAKEDGHAWRGEPQEQFLLVVSEAERMAEVGFEEYRAQSVGKLKALIQRTREAKA